MPNIVFTSKVYVCHIQTVNVLTDAKGFECDAGNARKSADKHLVSQAEAEQVFLTNPCWCCLMSGTAGKRYDCMRWGEPRITGFRTSLLSCVGVGD